MELIVVGRYQSHIGDMLVEFSRLRTCWRRPIMAYHPSAGGETRVVSTFLGWRQGYKVPNETPRCYQIHVTRDFAPSLRHQCEQSRFKGAILSNEAQERLYNTFKIVNIHSLRPPSYVSRLGLPYLQQPEQDRGHLPSALTAARELLIAALLTGFTAKTC